MTDSDAIRVLIGDTEKTYFTDDEISMFINIASVSGYGPEYFYAAALALNSLASKNAAGLVEYKIGDYQESSGRNKVNSIKAIADNYMELYRNTPAFAVAETDESDLNALIIIRNYVLRTNPCQHLFIMMYCCKYRSNRLKTRQQ